MVPSKATESPWVCLVCHCTQEASSAHIGIVERDTSKPIPGRTDIFDNLLIQCCSETKPFRFNYRLSALHGGDAEALVLCAAMHESHLQASVISFFYQKKNAAQSAHTAPPRERDPLIHLLNGLLHFSLYCLSFF